MFFARHSLKLAAMGFTAPAQSCGMAHEHDVIVHAPDCKYSGLGNTTLEPPSARHIRSCGLACDRVDGLRKDGPRVSWPRRDAPFRDRAVFKTAR